MGIYIKGMDFLPEDGTEFVVKKDEYGTWIKPIGHMGFSMRLIDVPEPHGRLIDESKVIGAIHERLEVLQTHKVFMRKHGDIDLLGVMPYIARIPTVIEAEPDIE